MPLDHFNDYQGLCCALQLKDAPSRAAGPGSVGSVWTRVKAQLARCGRDLLDMGVQVLLLSPSSRDRPDQVCTAWKPVSLALLAEKK